MLIVQQTTIVNRQWVNTCEYIDNSSLSVQFVLVRACQVVSYELLQNDFAALSATERENRVIT